MFETDILLVLLISSVAKYTVETYLIHQIIYPIKDKDLLYYSMQTN